MGKDAVFSLEARLRGKPMRFLIIDDSITMRRIIANILNRLGYSEVVHASNGREALDRLATEPIDIVVTDWYMPEMNGLDFVRALRTSPATKHIPIVIVTANAASDDIAHALELGVNSYILKPFTAETMREKIAALLTAAGQPVRADDDLTRSTPVPEPVQAVAPAETAAGVSVIPEPDAGPATGPIVPEELSDPAADQLEEAAVA
jgi:two-component system chemotaxis response regulator CheY